MEKTKEKKVSHTMYLHTKTKETLQEAIKSLGIEGDDFILFSLYVLSIHGILPKDIARRIKDRKDKLAIEILTNQSKPYTLVDAININKETLDGIKKEILNARKENLDIIDTLLKLES